MLNQLLKYDTTSSLWQPFITNSYPVYAVTVVKGGTNDTSWNIDGVNTHLVVYFYRVDGKNAIPTSVSFVSGVEIRVHAMKRFITAGLDRLTLNIQIDVPKYFSSAEIVSFEVELI